MSKSRHENGLAPCNITRRSALGLASLGLSASAALRPARAQGGGRGSTRIVVPYAPGGTNDITSRLIAPRASERLGETWVIENRSGANGAIGADVVRQAVPDGKTLLYANDVLVALRYVQRNVPFDIVSDFTPVMRAMNIDFALVGAARHIAERDIGSLLAAIRRDPARFTFASSTLGAVGQIAAAALGQSLGVDVTIVGYRGSGPATNDVLAGNVALAILPVGVVQSMLQSGDMRAFAVTSASRFAALPEVPTMVEAGLHDFVFVGWNAIWGPKGLPVSTIEEVHAAVSAAMREPEVRQRLLTLGCTPVFESPADFAAVLVRERTRIASIIQAARIQPE